MDQVYRVMGSHSKIPYYKMIAYQSSRGVVSVFNDRFLKGEGSFSDNTWETLKVQLRLRFGELQDEVQALAY